MQVWNMITAFLLMGLHCKIALVNIGYQAKFCVMMRVMACGGVVGFGGTNSSVTMLTSIT